MYIEKYLYCMYDLDYDYHIYRKHSNIKFFISLAIILVQGLHIRSCEMLITMLLKICIFHICLEL